MLSLLHITNDNGLIQSLKQEGAPLWISGILMFISASSLVLGLQYTSVTNIFVIFCASPVITAIFSRILLKEAVTSVTLIASAVVILGVLTVVSGSLNTVNILGDGLALLSVMSLSFNQTYLRKHKDVKRVATIGVGGLLMALLLFWFVEPSQFSKETWLIMGAMSLFTAPLGRVLSQVATRYITATEVGMILMCEAVLAPYLAFLFLGEIPSSQSIIGGTLIFVAVFYFVTQSARNTQ